jgi:hypothetical protein
MFCTFEGLEGPVPQQMRETGFQFWDAAVLPSPVPWYLLSVQRGQGPGWLETVFVASESMLIELLSDLGRESLVGLLRFDAGPGETGSWRMTRVCEVWCDWRLPEGSRLFFALQGESGLRNAALELTDEVQRAWLVARIPAQAAAQEG